jgi:hypothetical protein
MKGGVDVQIHIFLTSVLAGGEWSVSHPGLLISEESVTGSHWIGAWLGPKACLNDLEKRKFLPLPGLEIRSLGRRAPGNTIPTELFWLQLWPIHFHKFYLPRIYHNFIRDSRDSSVDELRTGRLESIAISERNSYFLQSVQTGSRIYVI